MPLKTCLQQAHWVLEAVHGIVTFKGTVRHHVQYNA
jgi:hypothetical protein